MSNKVAFTFYFLVGTMGDLGPDCPTCPQDCTIFTQLNSVYNEIKIRCCHLLLSSFTIKQCGTGNITFFSIYAILFRSIFNYSFLGPSSICSVALLWGKHLSHKIVYAGDCIVFLRFLGYFTYPNANKGSKKNGINTTFCVGQ